MKQLWREIKLPFVVFFGTATFTGCLMILFWSWRFISSVVLAIMVCILGTIGVVALSIIVLRVVKHSLMLVHWPEITRPKGRTVCGLLAALIVFNAGNVWAFGFQNYLKWTPVANVAFLLLWFLARSYVRRRLEEGGSAG